ncbi:MAG: chemotaxis protein CheW [Kofleriaceae bacterium]|nr:chemotaxis protein CheW [Kofleriaceae bacterium]
MSYLTFLIGGEEYALALEEAREVIAYPEVTVVPRRAAAIGGVIHLRGNIVTIVDVAAVFGIPATATTKWTCVVVAEAGDAGLIGIVVDRVREVVELAADTIQPPPLFGTSGTPRFLRGVSASGDRIVRILDVVAVVEELARAPGAEVA